MKNERKDPVETIKLNAVYLFRVDGNGNEVGSPIHIGLCADGSADLALIPSALRETWLVNGVSTSRGLEVVMPKDGERFLSALLQSTNGYRRFRTSPKKI